MRKIQELHQDQCLQNSKKHEFQQKLIKEQFGFQKIQHQQKKEY